MALGIYTYVPTTNTFSLVSVGTQLSPITAALNGRDGETSTQRLYLRNNDVTRWYDTITITPNPQSLTGPGNVNSWTVKVLGGDVEPSATDWSNRISGTALTSTATLGTASPRRHFVSNVGSAAGGTDDYFPFWLQIVVPRGTRNSVQTGISLTLTSNEIVV